MNGTRTRLLALLTCAALALTPATALAGKKKRHRAHKSKGPEVTVRLHHTYDAGGDGMDAPAVAPGTRVNLFDPLAVALALGNDALGELGLPPLQLPQP